MQTRERSKQVPESWETVALRQVLTDDQHPMLPDLVLDIYTPAYSPEYEIFADEGGGKGQWHSCMHFCTRQVSRTSAKVRLLAESGYYYPFHSSGDSNSWLRLYHQQSWGSYFSPYGDPGRLDLGLPGLFDVSASGGFIPPPADLDSLKARSMRSMLPLIKAELSLVNSIIELKDLRRSIRKLTNSVSRNYHIFRNSAGYKAAIKKLGENTVKNLSFRSLTRNVAGGYLEYSFNLKPLLSDIRGVIAAMSQASGRINDLITRSGRRQRKHFVYTWQEYQNVVEPEIPGGGWTWQNQYHTLQGGFYQRTVIYDPTVFHAEVEYNYNYTPYQTENAQMLAKLDALGVNLNPAIIWNALPWSFVLDWVLSVGPYLDSMKVANMEPTINIHRYLWSIKRSRRITVTCGYRALYGLGVSMGQLPAVVQTAYRRQIDSPSTSLLETSGLSLKELSLGAALAITQSRH